MTTTQNTSESTNKCPQPSIAVVHPQYSSSNRVNLSATINKKLSPTTITVNGKSTTTILPTKQNQSHTTIKLESKKVNLNNNNNNNSHNHKVGEKVKKEERLNDECKQQDVSQIGNRHVKTTNSSSISLPNKLSTVAVASTKTYLTTKEGDKNDHFVPNNNSDNYLLSVASSAEKNTNSIGCDDQKQHLNSKQSDIHLPSHIHFKQIKTIVPGSELWLKQTKNNCDKKNNNVQQSNNCYRHVRTELNNNITATKCFASKLKQKNNNNNDIKDSIRPKPMGQQVLSLMMLDVGLMPANNHNQQQASPTNESHVSVKSSSNHNINSNCFFIDSEKTNGAKTIINCNDDDDAENRTNCSIIDNHKSYNEFNSLLLTSNVNNILQVSLNNNDSESNRSISLPSSPRLTKFKDAQPTQGKFDKSNNMQSFLKQTNGVEFIRLHRHMSARNLIDDYRRQRLSNEPLSNNKNKNNSANIVGQNQHSYLLSDNQDNHSIASSSCSSLNHCPPLLALSTHLDEFNFGELVTSKLDMYTKLNKRDFIKNDNTQPISEKSGQMAKQNEKLKEDFEVKLEKQVFSNINSCKKIQEYQDIVVNENETNNHFGHIKHISTAVLMDNIEHDSNIQTNPQLK